MLRGEKREDVVGEGKELTNTKAELGKGRSTYPFSISGIVAGILMLCSFKTLQAISLAKL